MWAKQNSLRRKPTLSQPEPIPAHAPRADLWGFPGGFAQPCRRARAHESPVVAASRLPSFQSQTKTGTVAGRFSARGGKSQLRFAGSGPHSPPWWRTRGRRCDLPLPFARKKAFRGPVWPVKPTWPSGFSRASLLPGRAAPRPRPSRHTFGGVLAQPFYNSKKTGRGQRILPHASSKWRGEPGWLSSAALNRALLSAGDICVTFGWAAHCPRGFCHARLRAEVDYSMADIRLSAFSLFFMPSDSFLAHQRHLEQGHGT